MSSVFEKNTFGQNKGSRKICLDKLRVYGIILWSVMESCPSGRRSMIGNHVYGEHRTEGSNPSLSAKKEVTFVYQKLLLFLSKPQAWHIITARSAVHIISPFGAVSHHALACISLQLDEIQHCVLMIYNASH